MNISNLEIGMTIKNYPGLCEILGIPKKTSNSKNAQMEDISRYCKLEKQGHKFIVKEIYNTPKPKKSNNIIYGGLVQILLADFLLEEESVTASRNYILRRLNMINEKYSHNKKDIPNYAKSLDLEERTVYDFFNTTDGSFKSILHTALKELENQEVILYTYEPILILNDNSHRPAATKQERKTIISARNQALEELGYTNRRDVAFTRDWDKFTSKVDKILNEMSNGRIKKYYNGYRITIHPNIALAQERMIYKYLENAEREGYKNELNMLLIKGLMNNARKRQQDMRLGKSSSVRMKKTRLNFDYVHNMDKLISDNIRQDET